MMYLIIVRFLIYICIIYKKIDYFPDAVYTERINGLEKYMKSSVRHHMKFEMNISHLYFIA